MPDLTVTAHSFVENPLIALIICTVAWAGNHAKINGSWSGLPQSGHGHKFRVQLYPPPPPQPSVSSYTYVRR